MGTSNIAEQELARWQQQQQQQRPRQSSIKKQREEKSEHPAQGVEGGRHKRDSQMVSQINTHGSKHGSLAHASVRPMGTMNPCGCGCTLHLPSVRIPLASAVLSLSSSSVATSLSTTSFSNSFPSSHSSTTTSFSSSSSSSTDYSSPLIPISHSIVADSSVPSTPPLSLPSLRLSVPHFDVVAEPHLLSAQRRRPSLERSTSSPTLFAVPPPASPAGSVLSFQSIAGETYTPDILLTPSSPLFSFLSPFPRSPSSPWPFARSRSFGPNSLKSTSPSLLSTSGSVALLSSVSRYQQQQQQQEKQQQQQQQHQQRKHLRRSSSLFSFTSAGSSSSSSSCHSIRHQRRRNPSQQSMDSSQASSNAVHHSNHRHGHRKTQQGSSISVSSTPRQRSRSTSSLVHLAQSFMEDSLLFRSSVVLSPAKRNHHHRRDHPSTEEGRNGKIKQSLSFFASMTSMTPVTSTCTTTTSSPHGSSALSSYSSSNVPGMIMTRAEARRVRGQRRASRSGYHGSIKKPRKSLADLLVEAQSHYISHRYPQALTLYLKAVREHESVQACNSLYALYTPAKPEKGLVRSDTRATRALIHALQIWASKRWPEARVLSDPTIGSLMNLDPLLVHSDSHATAIGSKWPLAPHIRGRHHHHHSSSKHQSTTSQPTSPTSASSPEETTRRRDFIESFFADGSSRFWRKGRIEIKARNHEQLSSHHHSDNNSHYREHHHHHRGALTDDNLAVGEESYDETSEGEIYDSNDHDDQDGSQSDPDSFHGDVDDECHLGSGQVSDEDQEEELDPEQRGQATGEIEDIVQKLCQMIQKGVLGLDELIVLDAIVMLQWVAQELANEADKHHKQERQEMSLHQSSLGTLPAASTSPDPDSTISTNSHENNDAIARQPSPGLLLLTQPLQFPDEALDEVATAKQLASLPLSRPLRHTATARPVHHHYHREHHLTPGQRALDLTFCRAMRIRIMSLLGWVHHQRREYKYGAQAYAVCHEITPKTGRIQVDTLQRKAVEMMRHCQEMDLQQQKDAVVATATATNVCDGDGTVVPTEPDRVAFLTVTSTASCASSIKTSMSSTTSSSALLHHDVSTPSTVSTAVTTSVCPLSAEGEQVSTFAQQQDQPQIVVNDAQVLEAAIRIAGLAMESSHQPTVYEGAWVLAAEREAQRDSALAAVTSPSLPPPISTGNKSESLHNQQQPALVRSSVELTKSHRKSRSHSRARTSSGTVATHTATKGDQHSSLLYIQTKPGILLTKNNLTTPETTSSTSSIRRPSMTGHSQSMPQLQPNSHHRHRHHHHHHHHKQHKQSRPRASGLIFGQPPKNPTKVMLSTCGHCGKEGTQMPLCVCKVVRYCNRTCRVANMEAHRATGCHAAYIGGEK